MKRISALVTAFVLVGAGLGIAPAAASEPTATPLVTGNGVYFDQLELLGASTYGVLYGRAHLGASGSSFGQEFTLRTPGGESIVLGQYLSSASIVGNMVVTSSDWTGGTVTYRNLSNDESGSYELPEGQTFRGAAPGGWLVSTDDPDNGSVTLYKVDAASKELTSLGVAPGLSSGGGVISGSVGDGSGAVLSYTGNGEIAHAVYVSFANPGTFVDLDLSDNDKYVVCDSLASNAAGCVAADATGATTLVRAPIDGSTATRIKRPEGVRSTAVNNAFTAWVTEDNRFASVSTGGGTPTLSTARVSGLVSPSASQFVISTGGTEHSNELRTVFGPSDAGTVIVGPQLSPVASQGIGIGAGRVAWTDSHAANLPVWSRSLTRGESDLTLGTTGLIAARSTGYGVAVSGRRTAFYAADPTSSERGVLNVATGTTVTTIAKDEAFRSVSAAPDMSGTRVLFKINAGWRLYDLGTGTTSALTWLAQAQTADLWGNYVAYTNNDGSVWRKDLTSSAATKVADAPGGDVSAGPTTAYGDWVGWRFVTCDDTDCTITQHYRNAKTLGPVENLAENEMMGSIGNDGVVIATMNITDEPPSDEPTDEPSDEPSDEPTDQPSDEPTDQPSDEPTDQPSESPSPDPTADPMDEPMALQAGHATAITSDEPTFNYSLRNPATGEDTPILGVAGNPYTVITDSGVAAWITEDAVPMVSQLADPAANQPRFLGNAVSKVLRPSATSISWYGEVLASAPLTSCSVAIKSGSTVVRTLACDSSHTAEGDALVNWDGKDSHGKLQNPGTYTWAITASNDDGNLLAADGSTSAVTGSFVVPAVKPVVTANPAAKTVNSGKTATFTAAAVGAPAPTVQWQVSTNGGKSWANMANKKATTLSFPATKAMKNYRYRALFTNAAGTVATTGALLTVK